MQLNPQQEKLIIEARSWLGTKWMHNQCLKGVGVDCINFIWAVTSQCGLEGSAVPSRYARIARYNQIEQYLDEHLIMTEQLIPSNILLFESAGFNNHVAFATDCGMIHASSTWGKVVEHPIDGIWCRTLKKQWQIFC